MFSQNDEEQVILDYFFGYQEGAFLDLGCNDGKTLSNTYELMYKGGWNAVYVDASHSAIKKMDDELFSFVFWQEKGYYSAVGLEESVYAFNLALGKENGTIILSESGSHLSDNDVALVSTVNPSEKKRFERTTEFTDVEVDCMTWESFIDVSPIKKFDFISMDIEGSELDVLPFMDLSETKLICIEWNSKESLKREYEKYLSGFQLIHTTPENLIYGR